MKMEEIKSKKKVKKKSLSFFSKVLGRYQPDDAGSSRRKAMPSLVRQAEALRCKLDANYPSFTKFLVKSHVSGCFWMGLPVPFCKKHLPQDDTYFILENQDGKKYSSNYIAKRTALSGGWRRFAVSEKLLEGDVLVFHLVSPAKFKVYIIREECSPDTCVRTMEQSVTTSLPTVVHDKDQEMLLSESEDNHWIVLEKEISGNSKTTKVSSENSKRIDPPVAVLNHDDITSFEGFCILVDELLKREYELPHHIKWSYYQLCCAQNLLLHAHLPEGVNSVLTAGIIIETVSVASAIRNCELPTFRAQFVFWDESINSLNVLGMKVEFLRTHLHRLWSIVDDPEIAICRQQCMELCSQQAEAEEEIKKLQEKISQLTRESEKRASNMEKLKSEIEKHELRFQEQVSAPW